MAFSIRRQFPLQNAQSKRAIANTARDPDIITNARTAPMQSLPRRHNPDDRQRKTGRAGGCHRIATQHGNAETLLILGKARDECRNPGIRRAARECRGHQITQRRGAHGCEVGQIHPQQFTRDHARRIIGQEMHACHQRIRSQHQLLPGGRRQQRGVIAQIQRTFTRQRAEMPRDQGEFAGQAHAALQALGAKSAGRSRCASVSSMPLA